MNDYVIEVGSGAKYRGYTPVTPKARIYKFTKSLRKSKDIKTNLEKHKNKHKQRMNEKI